MLAKRAGDEPLYQSRRRIASRALLASGAASRYGRFMSDDPSGPQYKIWAVGAAALLAWFAMLFFMFGDVL
jgi:hypothetical protein